jgi:hypothetical protein
MAVVRDLGDSWLSGVLVSTRIDGNARPSRLRWADLERRFPGLLTSIVSAAPPATGRG